MEKFHFCKKFFSAGKARRDTISRHLKSLAAVISETLERTPAGRSFESFTVNNPGHGPSQVQEEGAECKIYHETICAGETGAACERIPVRLCADGCEIQEGETHCHTDISPTTKRVPKEQCGIYPRKVCKKVTKMIPQLIAKDYCQKNPAEMCQLKFNKTKESAQPSLQPVVQRYCLDQSKSKLQPRKLDVTTGFQNIGTQQVKQKKGTTTERRNYQTTTSGTTQSEETTTFNTLDVTEQSATTETITSEDTTELAETNPGIIKLKDVLKNYNNFKNEIISKNLNRAGKDDGVLKPIKPSILRRRTSPPPTLLPAWTTLRGEELYPEF